MRTHNAGQDEEEAASVRLLRWSGYGDSVSLSRIPGVQVRPPKMPSGLSKRVTVWLHGSFFVVIKGV